MKRLNPYPGARANKVARMTPRVTEELDRWLSQTEFGLLSTWHNTNSSPKELFVILKINYFLKSFFLKLNFIVITLSEENILAAIVIKRAKISNSYNTPIIISE